MGKEGKETDRVNVKESAKNKNTTNHIGFYWFVLTMVLLIGSPHPTSIPFFPKGNVYGGRVFSLPSPSISVLRCLDFAILILDTLQRTVYLRLCTCVKRPNKISGLLVLREK